MSLKENSKTTRMFTFISKTWNPFVGCKNYCKYCWARKLAKRSKCEECKNFTPHMHRNRLEQKFRAGEVVFIGDMGDIAFFQSEANEILEKIEEYPQTTFLFLTKDPQTYLKWINPPPNIVFGATIETNRNISFLSKAPHPAIRFEALIRLAKHHPNIPQFISIEPIMDFDEEFIKLIKLVNPYIVAIGYDNYKNKLPEPNLSKTTKLIEILEASNIIVHKKTIRKAWWE